MRLFQKIAQGVDVLPLLHALGQNEALWNQYRLRTKCPDITIMQDIDDIWLRAQAKAKDLEPITENILALQSELECVNFPAFVALPQARIMLLDLVRRVEGCRLGRVMITRLAPGKTIPLHKDSGLYAEYYQRYHITLQNGPGSLFMCDDETVCMAQGEVWWFDSLHDHAVINNSADDRITMIVDIRPLG